MDQNTNSCDTHIERNRRTLVELSAISVLAILVAVGVLAMVSGDWEDWEDWEAYVISWLLLVSFSGALVFAVYRLVYPGPAPVRLTPDDFLDRRAGKEPVPWFEIRNVARRGSHVYITMRLAYARTYPFTLSQQLIKATQKRAGPSHLVIRDWALNLGQTELQDLIETYWKRYAEG